MIVDTSALIAVLEGEPGSEAIRRSLSAQGGRVSAASLVEARVVAVGKGGAAALRRLAELLRRLEIDIEPFDRQQADIAVEGYRAYGKGTGHPARLNLGDAYSYALAIAQDEPLLFVGHDFALTDVRSALAEQDE